ncbi:MAG: hypothetical protein SAJ12_17365 [Jaaginema sp. PMC 1079.18]|nr:hypothetical protein [Jaaginema sp. PMC 1080.18]MEC4852753.1 hypothetical protein [Jaaginema sp. PMC 1079.18]MEC4868326.1 hypothetical protein [Jaaginema sp. PMC 1078.18]
MLESLKPYNLDRFPNLITNVEVLHWGSELKIECINDPYHDKLPYQLYFYDCQDIQISVHSSENINDLEADLIFFETNNKRSPKSASIYTDIFEISVSYTRLEIHQTSHSPELKSIAKSL